MKKFQLQSFKSCQALQLYYRMCLHSRLFEKFKNLNVKIYEFRNKYLKHLKTLNKKFSISKHVDQAGYYNFGINHVNIQGRLGILNFEFQNL